MMLAATIMAFILYSACTTARVTEPMRKGAVRNTGESSAKSLCGNLTSCSFGEKRTCLLTDGVKSPPRCIQAQAKCEDVWKGYCKRPEVPICKDDYTECLCSCGQKQGYFDALLRKTRSVPPVNNTQHLFASDN
ncbi:uncharacterized protein LOC142587107 [Dermacentor variabilis]|uniref:uncharacterized protein LOC142587107 n=1 Tax=Dermacentor variabilis TaxID=34621 RepID=UPI003F5B4031